MRSSGSHCYGAERNCTRRGEHGAELFNRNHDYFLIETMIIKPFKKSNFLGNHSDVSKNNQGVIGKFSKNRGFHPLKKAPLSPKETGATFTYHRNKARNITVMCLNTPDTKSKSYTERRFLASALSALLV